MKINVSERLVRGEIRHVVEFRLCGKRRRLFFASRKEADAEKLRLQDKERRKLKTFRTLNAAEQSDVIAAYQEAKTKGVDLFSLVTEAKEGTNGKGPKLQAVVNELVEVKEKAGKSERYCDNLRIVLGQFAKGRESLPIGSVTLAMIEAHLDKYSLRYRTTLRARISTLLQFAVRRGYRPDNPCNRLEPITHHRPPPEVFTVQQTARAFLWLDRVRPHALPWFVLSTFCGLRPEEAERTAPKYINFEEGFIRVEAQTTKVRQRRVVYPKPDAMRLLEVVLKCGGVLPLDPEARRYALTGLRDRLGFKHWPKDITRHSAASYWLAEQGSSLANVAKMLGHSEHTCESRYKALVTQAEANHFWRLVTKLADRCAP